MNSTMKGGNGEQRWFDFFGNYDKPRIQFMYLWCDQHAAKPDGLFTSDINFKEYIVRDNMLWEYLGRRDVFVWNGFGADKHEVPEWQG